MVGESHVTQWWGRCEGLVQDKGRVSVSRILLGSVEVHLTSGRGRAEGLFEILFFFVFISMIIRAIR